MKAMAFAKSAHGFLGWCKRRSASAAILLPMLLLLPSLGGAVGYEYDELGRLIKVTQDDGTITTYVLDPAGNRTNVTSGAPPPPPGTLQFTGAAFTKVEGSSNSTVAITVSRINGSAGAASVNYATVTGGTATAGTDYTTATGTLNWAAGDAANKTFNITVVGDAAVEPDETVNLQLSAPVGSTLGTQTTAVLTITNDDSPPPPGTLQFTAATFTKVEGSSNSTVAITVSRINGSAGAASVNYATVTGGTATAGTDYTTATGTLNWAAGDAANKTFNITVVGDAAVEPDETVNLQLSAPVGSTLGTQTTAVLTITNDDSPPPPGTLQFTGAAFTKVEGSSNSTVAITVSRINGSAGAASVNYATVTGGTATAGTDYTTATGTLNWAAGDAANKTFNITVVGDAAVEPDETVNLQLSAPVGSTLGTQTTAVLTITNDDSPPPPGTLQFTGAAFTKVEGSSNSTVAITVSRINGSAGAASVNYATVTGGTATAGTDYTTATGTLNWAAGDAANKTFNITVVGDAAVEPDETVNLQLSAPVGSTLGTQTTAVLTITNDDNPPPGSMQWSSTGFSGGEASGQRTITVVATRTGGSFGAASVNYTLADVSATIGTDYNASNGTLSWLDGDATAKSFTITVLDDAIVEGAETLTVTLSGASGASLGTPNSTTVTINSDDNPPPGSMQWSSTGFSGGEASGQRTITVVATRTGGSFGAASVNYTLADVSATIGTDYNASNGTLSWLDGDATAKSFTITVLDDAIVEGAETLTVTLSGASGASLGTPNSTTVTINSDDNPPAGNVQLTASSYLIGELSTMRTFIVWVSRTDGSFGPASVNYTMSSGSAISGTDFVATSGTLNWVNGDTAIKTFAITAIDDPLVESDETATITLSGAVGVGLGSQSSAPVTITSEDVPAVPGSLQLASTAFGGGEAGGQRQILVTVSRVNGDAGAASVNYTLTPGTATAGVDYTATASGTLNWGNGDNAGKFIEITVLDDSLVESTETLTVTLSNAIGALMGSPTTGTVSITSDDTAGTVNIGDVEFQGNTSGGGPSTEAIYQLGTTGDVFKTQPLCPQFCGFADVGDWLTPKTGMSNYQARAINNGCVYTGGVSLTFNTWFDLGTVSPYWGVNPTGTNGDNCTMTIQISAKSNPSVILDSATVSFLVWAGD